MFVEYHLHEEKVYDGGLTATNYALDDMFKNVLKFQAGTLIDDYFPVEVTRIIDQALSEQSCMDIGTCMFGGVPFTFQCAPLSGSFTGRGIILVFRKAQNTDAV